MPNTVKNIAIKLDKDEKIMLIRGHSNNKIIRDTLLALFKITVFRHMGFKLLDELERKCLLKPNMHSQTRFFSKHKIRV